MNYEPVQRWADNAAYAAGRALNQGKDFFYSARDKALEAARRGEKMRQRELKHARAYLPTLHDKWDAFVENAGDRFSSLGSTVNNRFHYTEHALLKVGAIFLIYKAFTHRKQPVADICTDARARIEKRPIESAILALGIGYALGKILR